MLLAALWACLGAQTLGLKTASGQIYGLEPASWESTPPQAAPRLGLRALVEESVSAPPVGANGGVALDAAGGVRFGPTNPGPLPNTVVNNFRGSSYTQITVSEPVTLYRVSGGSAGEMGQYWTTIRPSGPLQAQIDLALKPEWGNTATQITTIKVPPGQTIYQGAAASQGGAQIGGGSQVFIPRVDPTWVVR